MTQNSERQVRLDAHNLRGIAHPVRLRMLGLLRSEGPATASVLARRLRLNTGATSYHLRQLAEHGFIVEEEGRGRRRERWWRAAHADTAMPVEDLLEDTGGLGGVFLQSLGRLAADNVLRAMDAFALLPPRWRDAEDFSDYLLDLTPAQAKALTDEVHDVVRRHRTASRSSVEDPDDSDAAPVTFQFQLIANLEGQRPA